MLFVQDKLSFIKPHGMYFTSGWLAARFNYIAIGFSRFAVGGGAGVLVWP